MKWTQAGLTGVAGCLWIIVGLYICAMGLLAYYDTPPFQRMSPGQQWYEILFYGCLHLSGTASTVRKDNAPQHLSLLKKIVLNLIRLDTTDQKKTSLRLKRKAAAWDDDFRVRIMGLVRL
jgi:hypothetical protein